ncbi:MAG: hypothetical protein FWG88_09295 [Oscillospiraceae bacterium]|nr:hypothetical protein [Oscillospiraceae bacterium]
MDAYDYDFLNTIRSEDKIERAIVYNHDRSVFLPERKGTETEVAFTLEEFLLMERKILTHSHVDSGYLTDRLLSWADIQTAAFFRLHEIIAATPQSISAFSPGMVLPGNLSMRENFLSTYEQLYVNGAMIVDGIVDVNIRQKEMAKVAKNMSDYLKENELKFGYKYNEWGIF